MILQTTLFHLATEDLSHLSVAGQHMGLNPHMSGQGTLTDNL
jgi:hypothetical protein